MGTGSFDTHRVAPIIYTEALIGLLLDVVLGLELSQLVLFLRNLALKMTNLAIKLHHFVVVCIPSTGLIVSLVKRTLASVKAEQRRDIVISVALPFHHVGGSHLAVSHVFFVLLVGIQNGSWRLRRLVGLELLEMRGCLLGLDMWHLHLLLRLLHDSQASLRKLSRT